MTCIHIEPSDINECVLGTSDCTQLCNNTVGSYVCSCNTGYTLDPNNNHACYGEYNTFDYVFRYRLREA